MFRKLMRLFDRSGIIRDGSEVVSAVGAIRKMGLSSRSILIHACDGNQYVLKTAAGSTCAESSFREALGSELATLVGLPIPRWKPICVSESFMESSAHLWPQGNTEARCNPSSGYYFGSERVGGGANERLYDYLPHSWMNRIANRADFIGMLLLGSWANTANHRQVVFVHDIASSKVRAVFIGHGAMFSSLMTTLLHPAEGRYSDRRIYDDCWSEETFTCWKEKIVSITQSSLRRLFFRIPDQWQNGYRQDQLVSCLLARQAAFRKLSFRDFDLSLRGMREKPSTTLYVDIAQRVGSLPHSSNCISLSAESVQIV